jgi:beta-phosphoglucomutase-like phosphatase (HAD superfamily)
VLPGARELLKHLSEVGVRWAIGTSGDQKTVDSMIKLLRMPSAAPFITGDHVERAKPDPDIFLAANRISTSPRHAGDKVAVQINDPTTSGTSGISIPSS